MVNDSPLRSRGALTTNRRHEFIARAAGSAVQAFWLRSAQTRGHPWLTAADLPPIRVSGAHFARKVDSILSADLLAQLR